ncbi:MAG: hypothetical protein V2A72_07660 [Candidatus Omnitrophota bacterium]
MALPGGGVKQSVASGAAGIVDIKITQDGNTFHISKADVNKALSMVPLLIRDIKIMPHFERGLPNGIRLNRVKEGSVFEKAGAKTGDIVKNVNGMTLNTPYQIFQAYKKLKDEKALKVEMEREGEGVVLDYKIE